MWSFNGLIVYSSALLLFAAAFPTSESEWHCISDRKSVKLILWSAVSPNLLYTSSANRQATAIWRPTRINIVSNSMRFRCVDWLCALVALVSSVIALFSKWFHSWNRLFDRFSKSKLSGRIEGRGGGGSNEPHRIFSIQVHMFFWFWFFDFIVWFGLNLHSRMEEERWTVSTKVNC